MPFCRTRFNVWNTIILMTFGHFPCDFRLESGKMPCGLVFKQLPRDPANVIVWKNVYDPYILYIFHKSPWNERKISLTPLLHLSNVWNNIKWQIATTEKQWIFNHLLFIIKTLFHCYWKWNFIKLVSGLQKFWNPNRSARPMTSSTS